MKNNTAIVLLLLSVGLFYTFINPLYEEVKELQTLANEYRGVLKNVSNIIDLRDRLLVAYQSLPQTEINRINKVLPDNINTVRLALDLDSMASRFGVSIKNIQVTTARASGNENVIVMPSSSNTYETANVSFSFVSNYTNFIRILANLERNLRIMDIRSITFRSSDSGLYEYTISVDTYWLR